MRPQKILLMAIVVLSFVGPVQANDKKLGVTFDLTYMSKWMTKGKEGYSEDGIFFEGIILDLWGTGFGIEVQHQNPSNTSFHTTGDVKDKQRLNYSVSYKNSLFGEQRHETQYKLVWTYKNYYDRARNEGNIQAWKLTLSWPKLLSKKLEPYYITHYEYPAGSSYDQIPHWAGWVHRFGLKTKMDIAAIPNQLCFSSEIAYTDGLRAAEHDWSYATLGLSTQFKISINLSFEPGIYHQISMDDSVCNSDVTYCSLGMKHRF